jgi:hypothetical protein
MRASHGIAALMASLGLAAHAGEGVDASTKVQAVNSIAAVSSAPALAPPTGAAPRNVLAPFTAARSPLPDFTPAREEARFRGPSGACESGASICYDLGEGRIVFRPARRYMPKLGELEPDSISLRPNRITFKYTFK